MPSHLHLGRSVLRAPPPRIEGRYAGEREYLKNPARTAELLVGAGLLLREDIPRVLDHAERHRDWLMSR
jgi:hypothetical protein